MIAISIQNEREWKALCEQVLTAGIAFGSVNSVAGLWQHPQLRQRPVHLPNGQSVDIIHWPVLSTLAPPAAEQPREANYVARAGEHNESLRREFG